MPASEAHIATERASRYLAQLGKHARALGTRRVLPGTHPGDMLTRHHVQVTAQWSETNGLITLTPWGACTMTATPAQLLLRIDAVDEEAVRMIQQIITDNLDRIGRRDGLVVDWRAC